MSRRSVTRTKAGVVVGACGLSVSAASAQPVVQVGLLKDSRVPTLKPSPWPVGRLLAGEVPEIRLGPLNMEAIRREDREAGATGDRRARYGMRREIAAGVEHGRWSDAPVGRVWRLDLVAEDAQGIRVHVSGMSLPPGAAMVVYAPEDSAAVAGPYQGRGPNGDGTLWTPTRGRDRVRVECHFPFLARGQTPPLFQFRLDGIQHIYRDPTSPTDGPCHNDVTCFPGWLGVAGACGGIGFIQQNAIFCSGQLINTLANDQTPYFLTSQTCIGSAAAAQSAEVFLGYRTSVCNGPAPQLAGVPRAAGCTLLASSADQDFSLLMIDGSIPTGVSWSGWSTAAPADGSPVATVHYPQGGSERISFGIKGPNPTCGASSYLRSNWVSGPTEPGSGGAGLFTNDADRLLVGVLSCGWSSCGNVTNDNFSPFSGVYAQAGSLLTAGGDDAFEPNDRCREAFSISPGTFNYRIVKSTADDWFTATVSPGASFSAQISYTQPNGDVDATLYAACEGGPLISSTGQTGTEILSWTNTGTQSATVYLRIFLASDTRNSYNLTIGNGPPPGAGACCLPGGCAIMSQSACAVSGGVFAGEGSSCASGCATYAYSGAPVSIPDGTTGCSAAAVAQVVVSESFPITGVGAGVRIAHGYQGDVKFVLKHMTTGTAVTLVDRPGSPPSTFGFPNNNYGAGPGELFRLQDAAPMRYDTPVVGVDDVSGAWKPESPLTAFVGENAAGAWQLQVQDCASGETGQIESFTLVLGRASAAVCYPNCDDSTLLPILTANDFLCYINLFVSGSTRANCDGSTLQPLLTGNDFQCFVTSYVAGCS